MPACAVAMVSSSSPPAARGNLLRRRRRQSLRRARSSPWSSTTVRRYRSPSPGRRGRPWSTPRTEATNLHGGRRRSHPCWRYVRPSACSPRRGAAPRSDPCPSHSVRDCRQASLTSSLSVSERAVPVISSPQRVAGRRPGVEPSNHDRRPHRLVPVGGHGAVGDDGAARAVHRSPALAADRVRGRRCRVVLGIRAARGADAADIVVGLADDRSRHRGGGDHLVGRSGTETGTSSWSRQLEFGLAFAGDHDAAHDRGDHRTRGVVARARALRPRSCSARCLHPPTRCSHPMSRSALRDHTTRTKCVSP